MVVRGDPGTTGHPVTIPPAPGSSDTVLVVDDDVATRASLLAVLAGAEVTAIGVASAEEALAFQAEQSPGLVVIDFDLPDANGLELSQALKERDPTLPVLLLTGNASLETAIAAVGQVDGYLLKPMATETFVEAVRRGLAHGALVAENRNLASRLERLSQNQALYDPLTGLPNRALLDDRINQALAICRRNHSALAILFIDLDGFKAVNDLFGHHVGDLALRELANRLAEARRRTDTIARFGGDEFVVVCPDVESVDVAFRMAEVILAELSRPVVIGGTEHRLTASIGIVVTAPGDLQTTADDLLRDADLAMYGAKDEGKAGWKLFDETMRARAASRHEVEQGLRMAMDADEFVLEYQPLVDLRSGGIIGTEALVRWNRPGHGLVPPSEFLGVADKVGLTMSMGRWILDHALADLARLRASGTLPEGFHMWVNLSPRQLSDLHFTDLVAELTAVHGIPPYLLGFEIAEHAMRDVVTTENVLMALHDLGVAVQVDDFGSGQSNLSWLQDLPITGLKIDGDFIASLDAIRERDGGAIVRGLIGLGHELHLTIVGEGVETYAQAVALRAMGCEFAQGFYFGRPGPFEQLIEPVA
ncbi:MAG TPA: EAL domain-containing protein [Acidimicrobiales bacterium]|nr:EAL domain-containing protein [Acidimicrobiales bacterium]